MKSESAKSLIYALAIFLLFSGCRTRTAVRSLPITPSSDRSHVVRVVDGDTLELQNGSRVRLIGVDTPELHHPRKPVMFFAEQAFQFTKQSVAGEPVRLEYDEERTDKYGRTLAYVYSSDGSLLNAELVKQGYGFAYTRFPFRYKEDFKKYEQEAREQERGLWKVLIADPETSHIVYLYQLLDESNREQARHELEGLVVRQQGGETR